MWRRDQVLCTLIGQRPKKAELRGHKSRWFTVWMGENHAITISKEHCPARRLGGLNSQPAGKKFPHPVINEMGATHTGKPIKASSDQCVRAHVVKKKNQKKNQRKTKKKKKKGSITLLSPGLG